MAHRMEKEYLTTGELSKRLNVSVRTIRYYDQIGLVEPSRKETGGKRCYSSKDILKLQKILLLKSLNLSLEDSRSILAEQSIDSILAVHKSLLVSEIDQLQSSLKHTQSLLNLLELEETIHWEDLISLVAGPQNEKMWSHYFSPQQQEVLEERLPKLESDSLATKKWINIIKRIELCLDNGIPPSSKEGQLILSDVDILTAETFGDDPKLAAAFWEARKSSQASEDLGLYAINPAVIEFLELADNTKPQR
ncbi:MerR family transcriptional regulator [Planococcus plakortidis]|uniref:MerR family transcriptional regulator n=1 Tax=Planococcus plakortidis TaxID=1038856 RepID=UPI003985493A